MSHFSGQRGAQLYTGSGGRINFDGGCVIDLGCGGGDDEGSCSNGLSAEQAGNFTWSADSGMSCAAGFEIVDNSEQVIPLPLDSWQLKAPAATIIGKQPMSNLVIDEPTNCPCLFSTGFNGLGNAPIRPKMLVSQLLSYSCRPCPAGTHSAKPGWLNGTHKSGSCNACAAGQYQDETRQVRCIDCAPNKYQKLPGQKSCEACPGGQFQSARGQASCTASCPLGTDCTLGVALQVEGWWRPTANLTEETTLYACFQEGVCVGSEELTKDGCTVESCLPAFDKQCAQGYEGPVCALCVPNYTRQGGKCKPCASFDAQNRCGVELLVLFVPAFTLWLYHKRRTAWTQPVVLKITVGKLALLVPTTVAPVANTTAPHTRYTQQLTHA